MIIDPARPVVAVYGSNTPGPGELSAAHERALAIRRRGAILLTGDEVGEPDTVKGAAIQALIDGATPKEPACWIGVANKRRAFEPRGRGLASVVVTPGWGHRRNFVEAVMCDAAFAVGGNSEGTASEALFCLSRPRTVSDSADTVGPREAGGLVALGEVPVCLIFHASLELLLGVCQGTCPSSVRSLSAMSPCGPISTRRDN